MHICLYAYISGKIKRAMTYGRVSSSLLIASLLSPPHSQSFYLPPSPTDPNKHAQHAITYARVSPSCSLSPYLTQTHFHLPLSLSFSAPPFPVPWPSSLPRRLDKECVVRPRPTPEELNPSPRKSPPIAKCVTSCASIMSRTNAPLLRVPCQSAVESSSSQCNSRQCPSPAAVFSRAFPAASFTGDQLYIYPPTGMLYMK